MEQIVNIIGAGLAGSEAALSLANRGFSVKLFEMRPEHPTPVHKTGDMAELVCSNSLKSKRSDTAAGMLKGELAALESPVYACAVEHSIDAGGALAVDRVAFAHAVTRMVEDHPRIDVIRREVRTLADAVEGADAVIVATGPLTSDGLAADIASLTGSKQLAFYDAAAPIVMADSLNMDKVFRQSRYEDAAGEGDYLNCPFSKDEYDAFIRTLVDADRVVKKDFETAELFQACQPIEEIARKGADAPRFGAMKPVGLTDPTTGRRPWAAVQLRAEDAEGMSYNLVGFQTNLTFPEQRRVFRMIPGLENAEFARFGVMHRNTYLNAPALLDATGELRCASDALGVPVYVAGQLSGTEGYTEAIRSGLHAALSVAGRLRGVSVPEVPVETAFGALILHATDPSVTGYQPMHVNFGIFPPLPQKVRNKKDRYAAYAERGQRAIAQYAADLGACGLMGKQEQ